MTKTESRRRAALNLLAASSLSDDSDSEIIFDRVSHSTSLKISFHF